MANHDILLTQAQGQADMEQGLIDDESFRKMAEEVKRPRPAGVSLFRHSPADAAPVTLDQKTGRELVTQPLNLAPPNPDRVWESLSAVTLDATFLARNGLFTNLAENPAAAYFDILRTRLLQAMAERGWRRIAVTSPTHGCGKSFVAANLALSLARRPSSRTVLLDLELRAPALAGLLGVSDIGPLREFLLGDQPLESQFRRVGRTLALGLNAQPAADAAELLHEPATAEALAAIQLLLDPQVIVCDAPPVLVSDDVLALAPLVDAVLLVVDGTRSTADEVRACERLFEGRTPLMGIVLNRAQDRDLGRYRYGKKK